MGKTVAELTIAERHYYSTVLKQAATMLPLGDKEKALAVAHNIGSLLKHDFGATAVLLFGSLSGGIFGRRSDIDIGVLGISDESFYQSVAKAESAAAPFNIDVIDLDHCPNGLRASILSEGIPL